MDQTMVPIISTGVPLKKQSDILLELNEAFEQQQFEVYYQPYFFLGKGSGGVEALIQWNHPEMGVISLDTFSGVVKETSFVLELEKWALRQAIQDVKRLNEKGLEDLMLSVNISEQHLENINFPEVVEGLLVESSFVPEYLTLEVTEHNQISSNVTQSFEKIKKLGIKIAIAEFGKYNSSIHYLKDMPADELKIDRSFISKIKKDLKVREIVQMIITVAHELNIQVVAEGVETESQFQLLKKMKCDKVQGSLFSNPMTLKQFKQKFIVPLCEEAM